MQNKKFLKSKYSKKLKKISIWGIQKKKKRRKRINRVSKTFRTPLSVINMHKGNAREDKKGIRKNTYINNIWKLPKFDDKH